MDNETPFFIRTEHLTKQVQSGDSQIVILQDVNLSIKKGESAAIIGASGSGKTTLLTLLAGLDSPTSGNIYIQSHLLNQMNDEERAILRGTHIGFIFQSFQLLPTLTALENVMLPLEIRYTPHTETRKRALDWLARVGLSSRISHYPSQLSGGEQQRVAIARAFVTEPALILADEMTGNLDTHTGDAILDTIFTLNREQATTLVLVTHDSNLASRCHQRLLLQEGVLLPC